MACEFVSSKQDFIIRNGLVIAKKTRPRGSEEATRLGPQDAQ